MMLPPPSFIGHQLILGIAADPQKTRRCQLANPGMWHLDRQIDGGDFLEGPKHFQESGGGQFKTWWGQHHDFLK